MAHSFVQFFEDELEAFQTFQDAFRDDTVLVVDTYDSLEGVRTALQLQKDFRAVRLDSGDLAELAFETRRLLDEAGRKEVRIFASGNLNEERLLALRREDVPIDGYGLGTELVTSADAPTCDFVYKLVEVRRNGRAVPKFKTSSNKSSLPYRKQIFRILEGDVFAKDIVGRWEGDQPSGYETVVPLLEPVIVDGKPVGTPPTLAEIRQKTLDELSMLPEGCGPLLVSNYPVLFTSAIKEVRNE
jgi:nicotinate phosphoribosyltransferase